MFDECKMGSQYHVEDLIQLLRWGNVATLHALNRVLAYVSKSLVLKFKLL